MNYTINKVKNCLKNAQTYEYTLATKISRMLPFFSEIGTASVYGENNKKFVISEKSGTFRIVALLESKTFKISFIGSATERKKREFETLLDKYFGDKQV